VSRGRKERKKRGWKKKRARKKGAKKEEGGRFKGVNSGSVGTEEGRTSYQSR